MGETLEDLADALVDLARDLGRSDKHDFKGAASHDGDFVPAGTEDFGGTDGAKSDAELISLNGADEVDLGRGVDDEEGFTVGVGVEEATGKYVTAHDEEGAATAREGRHVGLSCLADGDDGGILARVRRQSEVNPCAFGRGLEVAQRSQRRL